jgi:hypothetical protein
VLEVLVQVVLKVLEVLEVLEVPVGGVFGAAKC